ncbi:GNAT family N-acetyltransferase [Halomarina pelagica]|uniref:GNAT family N-acetyltransferase n=1 Tax=Halomarina pelagica TaxID=2961599 RepID=UPI0020C53B3F|nr:GNAT family N-acetyltransferase [Halomarina sp. BND7]
MRVRPATPDDAPAILDLHVASIRAFGPAAYDERQVEAWATTDGPPDYPIGEPGQYLVVAEREGELAGFGHLHVPEAEVRAVYVHPGHARRGVGSALLGRLEAEARGRGIDELSLSASRNAVPFYEALGWERVREASHETSGGVVLPVVVMRRSLDGEV